MKVLQDEFKQEKVDKNILSDIVGITYFARIPASSDGMLGSNKKMHRRRHFGLIKCTWTGNLNDMDVCECLKGQGILHGSGTEAFRILDS